MINVQAIVLKLLLSCTDKDLALICFDKIKPHYFSSAYGTLHKAIAQYYDDHGNIPSMGELSIKFSRNSGIQIALAALQNLDDLDIDVDMAIDALRDEFAQQEALSLIQDTLLKDISCLSAEDIIDRLSAIPIQLDEKVQASGTIVTAGQIPVFQTKQETELNMMYTGISNTWDNRYGGVARQEAIFLGGKIGSGKSVVCANMCVNQYKLGNIAPYFSIEMTDRETLLRMLAILAGVDARKVKQQSLEGDELKQLALTRAKMFHGGAEAYTKYIRNKGIMVPEDFVDLDKDLMKNHEEIHPLIIVADKDLKMSTIDLTMTKFKTQYGDKLTMGVVDYINEVRLEGGDPYDWVYQLQLARGLKRLAQKHDCAMFSPYQINDDGSARFSKSLLIPVDIAMELKADHEAGMIGFHATKVRSMPPSEFNVGIDWKTLRIDPAELDKVEIESAKAEAKAPQRSRDEEGYELQ